MFSLGAFQKRFNLPFTSDGGQSHIDLYCRQNCKVTTDEVETQLEYLTLDRLLELDYTKNGLQ
jgi:hypothetical protein